MLFVTTTQKSFGLHVGEKMPFIDDVDERVIVVQADGDELEKIYHDFHLPVIYGKNVVKYFGDIADFIVHNW